MREAELQAQLKTANDLLLQRDRELEAKCRKAEKALHEKVEEEKKQGEEIQKLKDVAYVCYEQGFDEALAQVKHFANKTPIDLSRVDQERKLEEILVKGALTNQDASEAAMGPII